MIRINLLKKLRTQHDLTMEHIAKTLNVATQTYFKYENGIITNIPTDKLEKLAKLLNVSPCYLMGWTDEPQTVVSKTATTELEQRHLEKYRRLTVDNRTKLDNYMDGLLYEQEDYFEKREPQYSSSYNKTKPSVRLPKQRGL